MLPVASRSKPSLLLLKTPLAALKYLKQPIFLQFKYRTLANSKSRANRSLIASVMVRCIRDVYT